MVLSSSQLLQHRPPPFTHSKNTDIFQVPEAAQEAIPEKKVPKAPFIKPETPPATGICEPRPHFAGEINISSILENSVRPWLFLN